MIFLFYEKQEFLLYKNVQLIKYIQLIISALHSMHAYCCSIFILPKKVLKKIDKISRRFVWRGTELNKSGANVA